MPPTRRWTQQFDCREGVADAVVECLRDVFYGIYVAFRALQLNLNRREENCAEERGINYLADGGNVRYHWISNGRLHNLNWTLAIFARAVPRLLANAYRTHQKRLKIPFSKTEVRSARLIFGFLLSCNSAIMGVWGNSLREMSGGLSIILQNTMMKVWTW